MKKILVTIVIFIGVISQATADILITPTRVVFDTRDRVQEVIVVNTTNEERTYALSWTEMTQVENSSYRILQENEQASFARASEHIRFSPRRLTLQPGENQRIKLSLRRSAGMSEPEYRSHLKFTVIPNDVINNTAEDEPIDGIAIKLNLFLNYSIPVMVKNERTSNSVNISNVQIKPAHATANKADIAFALKKTNDSSVIGDITLAFKPDNGSDFVPVGFNNNVSIYHERDLINLVVPWSEPVTMGNGELKITFKGKAESADSVFSEAIVRI